MTPETVGLPPEIYDLVIADLAFFKAAFMPCALLGVLALIGGGIAFVATHIEQCTTVEKTIAGLVCLGGLVLVGAAVYMDYRTTLAEESPRAYATKYIETAPLVGDERLAQYLKEVTQHIMAEN